MNRPERQLTSRRSFLATGAAASCSWSAVAIGAPPEVSAPPQSVAELWADFDPRRDPIETEVIREWKEDGGVFRHVRYRIGTFKGKPARMAAVYGFPAGTTEKLPAVMHIHGGGQRGSVSEVRQMVRRGYAALSVNWGGSGTGKPPITCCEQTEPGDPNTDWGAVDPTQLNVPGYNSMLPGPKQFYEDREHPKNNNWFLLTLGCRRGLTFLEQQPEVDPNRLGVHGFSMGGNLTMQLAGTDDRVKAAVPAVGGQGWRWEAHDFGGNEASRQNQIKGDVEVFRRTLSYESYAPLIRCPVLHRSATNDFHGWMDDVYRTNALIAGQPTRYSWTPHTNHRLSPEVAVTMPLWFNHYLKGGPALPETPRSTLTLSPEPELRVVPQRHDWPVTRCEIFYSIDPDPRARFWRSAEVIRQAEGFVAKLPLHSVEYPLFAFANVYHELPSPEPLDPGRQNSRAVSEVCISSLFHHHTAREVRAACPALAAKTGPLIDDFSRGAQDWYSLNGDHVRLRQAWTRKLSDPLFRGAAGARLRLTLKVAQANRMTFVMLENEWRSYRGKSKTYVCVKELAGGETAQSLSFSPNEFVCRDADDAPLKSWIGCDQFGICAHYGPVDGGVDQAHWQGPPAELLRLEWV